MDNKTRSAVAGMVVSACCIVGIASYESYRGDAYKDAVGVATIGYGETKGVRMGDKTTPDRALVQLLKSTNSHADAIRPLIKVPLYQHEFDAYVSLTYNIGVGNFKQSTLLKKLNAGDYQGACKEILRWNRAGGKVLAGLTKRRQGEYLMCIGK